MRALRDRVAHHAVDADAGEHQRDDREATEQHQVQALRGNRIGTQLLHGVEVKNRLIGIDRQHLLAHRRGEAHRVAAGLDRHRHAGVWQLAEWVVRLHAVRVLLQAFHLDAPHDADDLDQRVTRVVAAGPDVMAYRVFVGPVAARELLVDERDARRVFGVGLCEVAPLENGDAQRAEVIGAGGGGLGERRLARLGRRLAIDDERGLPAVVAERQARRKADRFDARQRAQPRDELVIEINPLRLFLILRIRQRDAEGQQVVHVEAGVHMLQAVKAADHQPGAHQQHHRHHHLGDHQHVAQDVPPSGRAAPGVLQRFVQVRL